MCEYNITVAETSPARSIACCQTNNIHLNWDFVALRLSYGQFARLVQQVERTRVSVLDGVFEQTGEPIYVHCDGFSFSMAQADYLEFARLVTDAFDKLNGRAPRVFALQNGSHPFDEVLLPYEFLPN